MALCWEWIGWTLLGPKDPIPLDEYESSCKFCDVAIAGFVEKKNRVYKIVEMSVMHCTVVGTQLSSVVKHRCDGFSTGYVSRGLAVTPLRTPLVTDLRQGLRKQFTFVSGCNLLTDSDRNVLEFTAEKIVHAFRYLPVGCSSINTEIISRNTPRTRYYVGQPHGFPHKHTRILSHINRT